VNLDRTNTKQQQTFHHPQTSCDGGEKQPALKYLFPGLFATHKNFHPTRKKIAFFFVAYENLKMDEKRTSIDEWNCW
jgi:hypothetical protein